MTRAVVSHLHERVPARIICPCAALFQIRLEEDHPCCAFELVLAREPGNARDPGERRVSAEPAVGGVGERPCVRWDGEDVEEGGVRGEEVEEVVAPEGVGGCEGEEVVGGEAEGGEGGRGEEGEDLVEDWGRGKKCQRGLGMVFVRTPPTVVC